MAKSRIKELFTDKQVVLLILVVLASLVCLSVFGMSQGLDLKGGSLLQLQLEKPVDKGTMDIVTTVIDKRLNLFGVKDVKVRSSGDQMVIVEMADVTPEEIARLIGNPGTFEAKIDNVTVLTGADVESVDMYTLEDTTWHVPFHISPEGAKKFAELATGKQGEAVEMYLDGNLIDENPPKLSAELATGNAVTELEVTGGEDTKEDADKEANEVYTVLKTGSIPVKFHVAGSSTISPELGKEFLNGAIIAGLLAILGIAIVIFLRYRRLFLVVPIFITSICEVLIVMGIASVIHWNIDLAAIVGLIASIGTGVDDQIIITDEVLAKQDDGDNSKAKRRRRRTRNRLSVKNALFIIFASAGTLIAAMLPLTYVGFARGASGIGVLSGFAFTTILGVLVGVFITRPAYAKFVEIFIR